MEDYTFSDISKVLDYLRRINAYNVSSYFNRKYNFNIRIDPNNVLGGKFAKGSFDKYDIIFSTSGTGTMVFVGIYLKGDSKAVVIKTVQEKNNWGTWNRDTLAEGGARTIHGLHNKLKYFAKVLKIDLTPYEND